MKRGQCPSARRGVREGGQAREGGAGGQCARASREEAQHRSKKGMPARRRILPEHIPEEKGKEDGGGDGLEKGSNDSNDNGGADDNRHFGDDAPDYAPAR